MDSSKKLYRGTADEEGSGSKSRRLRFDPVADPKLLNQGTAAKLDGRVRLRLSSQ